MAQVTFQGSPISTNGNLPAIGQVAPDFTLVAADLSEKSLADFAGKRKVLNIFPSIDHRRMRPVRPHFQQTRLFFGQYRRLVHFCRFTVRTSPFLRRRRFRKM